METTPRSPQINGPVFKEIGKTGLKESGGLIYEEFFPKLQWPRAGTVYQEMRSNDPVVTAILLCCRMLIRQVTWNVRPASSSAADKEAAEFLKQCMDDMSMTWADFIDEVTSFFDFGFSYHEIVYKKRAGPSRDSSRNSKYTDNRIGWRKLPGRSQQTIYNWQFSDDGGVEGATQQFDKGQAFIPIERALLFRTTSNRGNPEGRSFLRGAYRPWFFKKHIEEVEGIGIERDLAGLPVLTPPEGIDLDNKNDTKAVEAKNSALNLISSIRRDRSEGVLLAFGWDLKLLSSQGTRQFDTNQIINRYDQRIAITLLADIVMLGADKVGSFALAEVKRSLLATALDAQLAGVAEIMNRYAIPRLFALNSFPGITNFPKLECSSVVAPDLNTLGNYIKALSGAKMPLFPDIDLENYLRGAASLPQTTEEAANRQSALNATLTREPTPGTNGDGTEEKPKKGGKEENANQ